MEDVFRMPVFPPADVFPMMSDDELQDLAADIAENGLKDPLVLAQVDGETMLVDGRNRRAACELARVTPETRSLDGEDPTAYVLSANMFRRHMTKGQLAMAVAKIYPEPEKGGRGKKASQSKEFGFSAARLSQARTVLCSSSDLAAEVLAGNVSLNDAYESVRTQNVRLDTARTQHEKLQKERPDLAELVAAEALTLEEALKQAAAEAEAHKQLRLVATTNMLDAIRWLDRTTDHADKSADLYDPAIAEARGETITPERLQRARDFLIRLTNVW